MNEVKLHYYIRNQGDGSAVLVLCRSAEEAEKLDEEAQENDGWGESSDSYETLAIIDGKICYKDSNWNPKKKKHEVTWVELKP